MQMKDQQCNMDNRRKAHLHPQIMNLAPTESPNHSALLGPAAAENAACLPPRAATFRPSRRGLERLVISLGPELGRMETGRGWTEQGELGLQETGSSENSVPQPRRQGGREVSPRGQETGWRWPADTLAGKTGTGFSSH